VAAAVVDDDPLGRSAGWAVLLAGVGVRVGIGLVVRVGFAVRVGFGVRVGFAVTEGTAGLGVRVIDGEGVVAVDGACRVVRVSALGLLRVPLLSVTVTEKLELPAVAGTPVMVPVAELRLRPAGNAPELMAQAV